MASLAPVEMIVLSFPGSRFSGEIIPAIQKLVETDLVRIIDIVLVTKDEAGVVSVLEINDPDQDLGIFEPFVADLTGLIGEADAQAIGGGLEPGSSAGLLVVEHLWAREFQQAVLNSGGELVLSERIPASVVDEILAART